MILPAFQANHSTKTAFLLLDNGHSVSVPPHPFDNQPPFSINLKVEANVPLPSHSAKAAAQTETSREASQLEIPVVVLGIFCLTNDI